MSRSRPADVVLLTLVILVVLFGLLMLTSASSVLGFERFGDSYHFIRRQIVSCVIGFVGLYVCSRLEYRWLRKYAFFFLLASVGLLVAVLIPGLGTRILGAQRWIIIGPLNFQPSEFVKLTLLVYLATWLDQRRPGGRDAAVNLRTFLILLAVINGLVLLQPDLGTMLVLGALSLAVYLVSGAQYRHIALVIGLAVAALLILIVVEPYRLQRLTVFLNPEADRLGEGYHITQSLIAIGSGGIFGVGLGHSRQKFNYLPEASGDSIFSVIAEEMGFIVILVLIALYLAIIFRGFRIARQAPDSYGRIIAVGITSWIATQTLINIGALSGLLPLTGVPLPLISYGGSAMVITLCALGILLNISRSARSDYVRRT